MRENLIEMKSTTSNPANNAVIPAENDDLLTAYLRSISKIKPLSMEEEKEFAKKAKEGNFEAKKKLVESNLKLVVTVAKKAIHVAKIPMIDLIQEGNLGLMVAVEKFNWELGYKFSTYASWWIKQAMFKAISEQGYCMKIPVYIQETLSKFSKVKAQMEREYNCQIKNEDVAQKINISIDKIESYLGAYSKSISIEGGFKNEEDKDSDISDVLADEKANVYSNVEFECLKNDIEKVISVLKDREQAVVQMRYGLGNFAKKTLEEIGNMYGVTKECIRQTEIRALKKMRYSVVGQEVLACYLN
jgi:RNA polymerase primary sigma factor